jgi:hypothetical protein
MDIYKGISLPTMPDKIEELKQVEEHLDALHTFFDQLLSKTKQFYIQPRQLTAAEITAINKPIEGDLVYNKTTKKINFYDGTNWRIVTST